MSSPSGTSSGNSVDKTDVRKRKRMLSNRESARRSRMRKQKHLDDLTAQVNNLRAENNHIHTNINLVTHLYLSTESDNSVLRAQVSELSHRLQALEEIISCMSSDYAPAEDYPCEHDLMMISGVDDLFNPRHVSHPIMASPDVFMY